MRMGTLGELMGKVRQYRKRFAQGEPSACHLDAPQQQEAGRVYEVPVGLLPRFFELYERLLLAEREGKGSAASYHLWRFLQDRCPELQENHWKLEVSNFTSARVIEVQP